MLIWLWRWIQNIEKFQRDFIKIRFLNSFARAWFKLTHRTMGNKDNHIGPWAPKEDLSWQGNVQPSKKKYSVEKVKKMIAASKLSNSDLIVTAWIVLEHIEEQIKEVEQMEQELD